MNAKLMIAKLAVILVLASTIVAAPISSNSQSTNNWPVWRTIRIGTGLHTTEDFLKALKEKGVRTEDLYGNDYFVGNSTGKYEITGATNELEIDLVKVTLNELGITNTFNFEQILARAKHLGLVICPAEVGPQLCLQYSNKTNDNFIYGLLYIGMEPITGPGFIHSPGFGRSPGDENGKGCWFEFPAIIFEIKAFDYSYQFLNLGPSGSVDNNLSWVFIRPRQKNK